MDEIEKGERDYIDIILELKPLISEGENDKKDV